MSAGVRAGFSIETSKDWEQHKRGFWASYWVLQNYIIYKITTPEKAECSVYRLSVKLTTASRTGDVTEGQRRSCLRRKLAIERVVLRKSHVQTLTRGFSVLSELFRGTPLYLHASLGNDCFLSNPFLLLTR
jgi:hypothetical protein